MDSDEDLPQPYAFQKRKKRVLNQDYRARPRKDERIVDIDELDDEDVVEAHLQDAKSNSKKYLSDFSDTLLPSKRRRRQKDSDIETSIESLMGVNPPSYRRVKKTKHPSRKGSRPFSSNMSERIINISTRQPRKNAQKSITRIIEEKRAKNKKKTNERIKQAYISPPGRIDSQSVRPPKALKRDATQELFPHLAYKKAVNDKIKRLMHSSSQDGILNENLRAKRSKLLSKDTHSQTHKDLLVTNKMNESNLDHIEEAHDSIISEAPKAPSNKRTHKRSKSREKFNLTKYRRKVLKKERPSTGVEKIYGNIDKFLIKPEEFELGDLDSHKGMFKSFIDTALDPESTKNRKLQGLESIYTQRLQVRPSTGKARNFNNPRFMFDTKAKFKPVRNNLMNERSTNIDINSDINNMVRHPTTTKARNFPSDMKNTASGSMLMSRHGGAKGPQRRIDEGGWV